MVERALLRQHRLEVGLLRVDLVLTDSSASTLPARLSSARSWLMAAWSEATRLAVSATCWVTSCACCASDSWVPSPLPVSAASVAW